MQVWPDGTIYEGYWLNGRANGKGRIIHADGVWYNGNWLNDKANGQGVYTHVNGERYEGGWHEDYIQGKGIEIWDDGGSLYNGQFLKGKKNGFG